MPQRWSGLQSPTSRAIATSTVTNTAMSTNSVSSYAKHNLRLSQRLCLASYKGLLLASPYRSTEFYFACIFCPTARKRVIYVLLVANSFIKASICCSLRSMLKAKAFTGCLHRQSRWFPYPMRSLHMIITYAEIFLKQEKYYAVGYTRFKGVTL